MGTSDADAVRYVEANGIRFAYLEEGQGPLALLLHGFPDTPHGWSGLIGPLAEAGYRVVAPFTRGYAPTDAPKTKATSVGQLAEDAIALIGALGHDSAVVIGHDWGAATAYLVAAREPRRVDRLVAVAIPHPATVGPSPRVVWGARHFLMLNLPGAAARVRRDDFAMIDHLYRRWSPTWRFGPEETAPVKRCFADPASLDAALAYYRGLRAGRLPRGSGRKIEVPTLAVAGEDDPALDVSAYENARRKFTAGYEVASFPGGHFVHRESPGPFVDAVLSFLSRGS